MFLLKYCLSLLLAGTAAMLLPVSGQNKKGYLQLKTEQSMFRLAATDALSRSFGPAGGKQAKEKTVGIFYSLWLGQHQSGQKNVYDIQKLSETNPEALNDVKGRPESPLNEFHFWGEPLYGYYNMSDPWVVTRHVELLTNAGVDYLCIDATNRVLYEEPVKNLLRVLTMFMEQGFKAPKIVFYTNSFSGTTVDDLYNRFYKSGTYDHLWFSPGGKPMIIGITEKNGKASDMTKYNGFTDFVKPAMQQYFDVRESQWPNGDYNPASIPWMSWQYPQWNHNGTVAVPVAQHSHSVIAASAMHPESSRGYNNATKQIEKDWNAGANFQTMWDAVFQSKAEINHVLVTSFNEWMAIKYANAHGHDKVFFVDVYNHEFSRDIEMMRGGYQDNFYLQLARNIRRFKLKGNPPLGYIEKTIDISKGTDNQWKDVRAVYTDVAGDAMSRNFSNATGTQVYRDSSNRNDIIEIKVAHDKQFLYFRVTTAAPVTAYNQRDVNWMNILIHTKKTGSNFAGYQYIVNRKPITTKTTSVEKSSGGYNWESSDSAGYTIKHNIMQVAVPLDAVGLTPNNVSFEFKVADHVTKYDDIMDYYITGDSAPIGRMNYAY
ncbi:hypothetical protein ACLOAU_23080 [Niabella sp. CJ426]|uniref:hypothetical protein n=1 Tax=Niabella sp. CJ426 TaxID=3393740 RepID=UPI003CFFBA68